MIIFLFKTWWENERKKQQQQILNLELFCPFWVEIFVPAIEQTGAHKMIPGYFSSPSLLGEPRKDVVFQSDSAELLDKLRSTSHDMEPNITAI